MISVFDLPSDYLTYVFTEWFEMEEIAGIDCAIANKVLRVIYLNVLSRTESVFSGELKENSSHERFFKWMMSRSMKTKYLYFPMDLTKAQVKKLMNGYGRYWEKINLYCLEIEKIGMLPLLKVCENLKSIHCGFQSPDVIQQLVSTLKNPRNITEFDINSNAALTSLLPISKICTNIRTLNIVRSLMTSSRGTLKESTFPSVIHFTCADTDNDHLLSIFFRTHSQLESIKLVNCYGVTEGLSTLSNNCTQLRVIEVFAGCTGQSIADLIAKCPLLTKCTAVAVGDECDCIVQNLTKIAKQMTYLRIEHTDEPLNNMTLNKFLKVAANLLELHLDSTALSSDVLMSIGNYCPNINTIILRKVENLSVNSMLHLLMKCSHLNTLILSHVQISDDTLRRLAMNGDILKWLGVNMDSLTDVGLDYFMSGFKNLRRVQFHFTVESDSDDDAYGMGSYGDDSEGDSEGDIENDDDVDDDVDDDDEENVSENDSEDSDEDDNEEPIVKSVADCVIEILNEAKHSDNDNQSNSGDDSEEGSDEDNNDDNCEDSGSSDIDINDYQLKIPRWIQKIEEHRREVEVRFMGFMTSDQ